ncbi:unnamed protein product [Tuwongella immobilis]|uniref:Repeat-companion domain protein n=2 Tax=Tuwongella immobilis TaxID=692036 RepID=A0A6C2YU71_9BACT|nr:unnamed protein product [Tuwongella immobilis]VTS07306.1 unnamed protein product [Tuwongella immobilis]
MADPLAHLLDAYYLGDDPETATLLLADQYEESGEWAYARFLRDRTALAQLESQSATAIQLTDATEGAMLAHRRDWALADLVEQNWHHSVFDLLRWRVGRTGIIEWQEIADLPDQWNGESAWKSDPSRKFRFALPISVAELISWLKSPIADRLRGLSCSFGNSLSRSPESVDWLRESGRIEQFTELVLSHQAILGDVADCPRLQRLRAIWVEQLTPWLDACANRAASQSLREIVLQLAESPRADQLLLPPHWWQFLSPDRFPKLQRLSVHGGASQLPSSWGPMGSRSSAIRELLIDGFRLESGRAEQAMTAWAEMLSGLPLRSLGLGFSPEWNRESELRFLAAYRPGSMLRTLSWEAALGPDSLDALAQWPGLESLSELSLTLQGISQDAGPLQRLLASPRLRNCRSLNLTVPWSLMVNHTWLRSAFPAGNLQTLRLICRPRGTRGMEPGFWTELGRSTLAQSLWRLELTSIRMTAEDIRRFLAAGDFPQLRQLQLFQTGRNTRDIMAILSSPAFPRLWLMEYSAAELPGSYPRLARGWDRVRAGVWIHSERME